MKWVLNFKKVPFPSPAQVTFAHSARKSTKVPMWKGEQNGQTSWLSVVSAQPGRRQVFKNQSQVSHSENEMWRQGLIQNWPAELRTFKKWESNSNGNSPSAENRVSCRAEVDRSWCNSGNEIIRGIKLVGHLFSAVSEKCKQNCVSNHYLVFFTFLSVLMNQSQNRAEQKWGRDRD